MGWSGRGTNKIYKRLSIVKHSFFMIKYEDEDEVEIGYTEFDHNISIQIKSN